MVLNLSSANGGFAMLLMNFLRGSILWPDKASATFASIIGNLDKRVELDKTIRPGDSRYYAALSLMSSNICYENKAFVKATVEDEWKIEFLGSFNFWNDYQDKTTTQAFLLRQKTSKATQLLSPSELSKLSMQMHGIQTLTEAFILHDKNVNSKQLLSPSEVSKLAFNADAWCRN